MSEEEQLRRLWTRYHIQLQGRMDYISFSNLFRKFRKEFIDRGEDPIILEQILGDIDPLLDYYEAQSWLETQVGKAGYEERMVEESEAAYEDELQKQLRSLREVSEKGFKALLGRMDLIETKDVERYEKKLGEMEKLLARLKSLQSEHELLKERLHKREIERDEYRRQLEDLRAEADKAKLEALEEEMMKPSLQLPLFGAAPPAKPPPAKKELSDEEKARLEDLFTDIVMRELGRIPSGAMAAFRSELETVKDRPYAEAERIIRLKADEVIQAAALPKPPKIKRIVPRAELPEIYGPPELGIYPAELPAKPISPLAFPRAPTSEEKAKIWEHFKFAVANMGKDYREYEKAFDQRINLPFVSWGAFLQTYQELLKEIESGEPGVLIPLRTRIAMPWRAGVEEYDAIWHFIATKLYPTMEDLIEALATYGVAVTKEDVRAAVEKGLKDPKNVWVSVVPKEFLQTLLGS